jgi:hypothetical protein
VQMSLKAVMPEKKAEALATKGAQAGGTTNMTPLS